MFFGVHDERKPHKNKRLSTTNIQEGFDLRHQTKQMWPLPKVTKEVLETVMQACGACSSKESDVFSICIRHHGATAAQVTSVLHFLKPDLSDTDPVTIQELMCLIERQLSISNAA